MRAIPAAVQTLLKSRCMIGEDAHNHEVTITGAPSGLGDPTWTTAKTFRGEDYVGYYGGGSFVKRGDDKILTTYMHGADVMLSYVDTEDDIFYENNQSATNEWVFATLSSAEVNRKSTLKKAPNGDLLLFVLDYGSPGVTNHTLKVYKSANGLGTDFSLLSTIYTYDTTGKSTFMGTPVLGHALNLDSGRMLLPWAGYAHYSSGLAKTISYSSYSDDNGATWTNGKFFEPTTTNTVLYSKSCRGFGVINGQIIGVRGYQYGTGSSWFRVSDDEGETWKQLELFSKSATGENVFSQICWGEADGYAYWLFNEGGSNDYLIYRHPDNVALSNSGQDPYDRESAWELITPSAIGDDGTEVLWTTDAGNLAFGGTSLYGGAGSISWIWGGLREAALLLRAKSIEVQSSPGAARGLSIVFDNKDGQYSPDIDGDWKEVMFPDVGIVVKQGYGLDLTTTFTGTVDDVIMRRNPYAEIQLNCRSGAMKKLLDQQVASGGVYSITYTDKTIEFIVDDLATKAGITSITTEATGLTLAEFIAEEETWADAIQRLADMVGFEWFCDELDAFYFVYATDRQPEAADEAVELNGTTAVDLVQYPVVTASIQVWSAAGKTGTEYTVDTDYVIVEGDSETAWTIARTAGGTIGDGATVYVSYVYAAYVFREGEDIISLDYTISGTKLSSKVLVRGASHTAETAYISTDYYNVPAGKVELVNAPEADTEAKCQTVADRVEYAMRAKARICQHEAIAVPWLQLGDCIQIIETTTGISEIYRIIGMTLNQRPEGFTMSLTTYHYGYSVAA
jgi:hypothetical protein